MGKCVWWSMLLIGGASVSKLGAEESLEARFLSGVQQLTSGFERAGEGYFSPDQSTIVYQAIRPEYPFYQIYSQRLAGGAPELMSRGHGRTTCSYYSPDGQRLLFSSSHLDPQLGDTESSARKQQAADRASGQQRRYQWDFDPHMDIFEIRLSNRQWMRLTDTPGYDAEGAYSPDGTQIVFCSDRDGDPDIYLMNADGSNVRQITNIPGYDGGPFISPDGRWIVYRSDRKRESHLQIHVIGVDGQHDVALTDNPGVNWGPYWHPTQPYLIWSSADHSDPSVRPNYDLWLMRYATEGGTLHPGPLTRITDHPSADVLPVFSPDGRKLMWTSTRTENRSSQLFIADFTLPTDSSDP